MYRNTWGASPGASQSSSVTRQNRVGIRRVFSDINGITDSMGVLSPKRADAICRTLINAVSNVVLPDPFGPTSTIAAGRRNDGLAALRRKQLRSGAVPRIRRSTTASSRMEKKLDTANS
ncbi:MAG: hypothetical protein OXH09_23330 [Gammaproteobacteria bacterium]|nr:hypothetical protein [Gammaproteobacteria bacterium]